tara:strand:+ start:469 stop:579 length:111 start_codon:yes stop_codon:yes gene_type:complete
MVEKRYETRFDDHHPCDFIQCVNRLHNDVGRTLKYD